MLGQVAEDPYPPIEDAVLREAFEYYKKGELHDGTLRTWDEWKGLGWIRPDDRAIKQVFCYKKQLSGVLEERHVSNQLTPGTRVMFHAEYEPGSRSKETGRGGSEIGDRLAAKVCICPSEFRTQLAPRCGEAVQGVFSPVGVHKPANLVRPPVGVQLPLSIQKPGGNRFSPYDDDGPTVRIGASDLRVQASGNDGTTVRVDANTVRVTGSADGSTVRITGVPAGSDASVAGLQPAVDPNWWGSFMSACMEYGTGSQPSSLPSTAAIAQPSGYPAGAGLLPTVDAMNMAFPGTSPCGLLTTVDAVNMAFPGTSPLSIQDPGIHTNSWMSSLANSQVPVANFAQTQAPIPDSQVGFSVPNSQLGFSQSAPVVAEDHNDDGWIPVAPPVEPEVPPPVGAMPPVGVNPPGVGFQQGKGEGIVCFECGGNHYVRDCPVSGKGKGKDKGKGFKGKEGKGKGQGFKGEEKGKGFKGEDKGKAFKGSRDLGPRPPVGVLLPPWAS